MTTLTATKPGRNDPCLCGSGRKYKRCHGAIVDVPASPILPGHPKWPTFKTMLKEALHHITTLDYPPVFLGTTKSPTMFSITLNSLKILGLSEPDAIRNIMLFEKYHGYSDLEILYNVERYFKGTIDPLRRKIVIIGPGGMGDDVLLTAVIREIKEKCPTCLIDVRTKYENLFLYNPNITRLGEAADDVEVCVLRLYYVPIDYVESIQDVLSTKPHYSSMLHCIAQSKLKLEWNHKNIKPDLHLGNTLNFVRDRLGFTGAFWLVNAGFHSAAPAKWYPHYQEVVDLLRGKVRFVQHGSAGDTHTPLNGVLSIVGQTSPLELAACFRDCSGSLGGASSHMHLAAAFNRPCVAVIGGIEDPNLVNYSNQSSLFKNIGCLNRFGENLGEGCGLRHCRHFLGGHAACMDAISPEMVADAVINRHVGCPKNGIR